MKSKRGRSKVAIPATPNIGSIFLRKDGLPVFLDDDAELNKIRLNEPDPRKVILAVAFRKAQLVACSYAQKHAPSLYAEIVKSVGLKGERKIKQSGLIVKRGLKFPRGKRHETPKPSKI